MQSYGKMLPTVLLLTVLVGTLAHAGESCETAAVRPQGGDYVPPPFSAVAIDGATARCGQRSYDLQGLLPLATVSGQAIVEQGQILLDGQPLAAPAPQWTLQSPAVAIARRQWTAGQLQFELRQTVEYDGFITQDLTLRPHGDKATVRELAVRLQFRPECSVLYHVPSASSTPAGLWPDEKEFREPIPGVWLGNDSLGMACYAATFRQWRNPESLVTLGRTKSGRGTLLCKFIAAPTEIAEAVVYRLGFIATPVRQPQHKHWQLASLLPGPDDLQRFVERNLFWAQLSDHYATFRTNDPRRDEERLAAVREVQSRGKKALAYTTYAHVEDGVVETPVQWLAMRTPGKRISASIGGASADRNRVFCCPGSQDWLEWKLEDLRQAIRRYQIDGLYVDTSYVIAGCANAEHGHGWRDAEGQSHLDFPVWSMREAWRQAYELLCRERGHAEIYAHHKGGCPAALAAFTTAFCDGEQYTSQSIKNLTLDAFRAQISGRNMGPLALFLCEYYRSQSHGTHARAQHHNPVESVMLPLLHDVLPTGYPGNHPVRELLALREDLGIADAAWTPYYASDNPWRTEGAAGLAVSAYATARGDTLLVVGNPQYSASQFRLIGPKAATENRTFVAIDALARVGRRSPSTIGYRWESADPGELSVAARSLGIWAWVCEPSALAGFAVQHGFASSPAQHARRVPVPDGATLLDDFEDPDWTLASDKGGLAAAEREPVDTRRAMRVLPAPEHDSAGLLRTFDAPQDWSTCQELSFWIRPDRELPVRAIEPRLSDSRKYGPSLALTSHHRKDVLPAGKWSQLRFEFRKAPRDRVHILRIYFNRGGLNSGPFDLDEMMLVGGKPVAGGKSQPESRRARSGPPTPSDRPDAPPE